MSQEKNDPTPRSVSLRRRHTSLGFFNLIKRGLFCRTNRGANLVLTLQTTSTTASQRTRGQLTATGITRGQLTV